MKEATMRRRTFDTLMATGGLVITVVLVIAGALAFVGYRFANDNVTQQLADQKIEFPAADSDSIKDPRIAPYLTQYAGQPLTTGAQAEAYANHYIGVHIADTGEGTPYMGMTYSELGGAQRGLRGQIEEATANNDPKLASLEQDLTAVNEFRETVFKGETLRGLLLNAYAWWKLGQIAFLASIVAFAVAAIMALLTVLGFRHRRRVEASEEVFAPRLAKHWAAS